MSALGAIVALGERMTVLPKITCDHAGAWNDDDTPATDGERETGTGSARSFEYARRGWGKTRTDRSRERVRPHAPETAAQLRAVDFGARREVEAARREIGEGLDSRMRISRDGDERHLRFQWWRKLRRRMEAQRFAARNDGAYGLASGFVGLSSSACAKKVRWIWIMADGQERGKMSRKEFDSRA